MQLRGVFGGVGRRPFCTRRGPTAASHPTSFFTVSPFCGFGFSRPFFLRALPFLPGSGRAHLFLLFISPSCYLLVSDFGFRGICPTCWSKPRVFPILHYHQYPLTMLIFPSLSQCFLFLMTKICFPPPSRWERCDTFL